jgi:hypothetical protein
MNSINSVISGLLASLLLSLGFSRLAVCFDRLNRVSPANVAGPDDRRSAAFCTTFCYWQED